MSDLFGDVVGGVLGAGDFISNMINREDNIKLLRESWAREDSAVQRRVADLRKAGMNPALAYGQAAASSGPIRLEAPRPSDLIDGVAAANAVMQQKKDIARQDKQIALLDVEKTNALQKGRADFMESLPMRVALGEGMYLGAMGRDPKVLEAADLWMQNFKNQSLGIAEDAKTAKANAAFAKTRAEDAARNLHLAKVSGVRSNVSSGYNEALEAMGRQMGYSGGPAISAFMQLFDKVLSAMGRK